MFELLVGDFCVRFLIFVILMVGLKRINKKKRLLILFQIVLLMICFIDSWFRDVIVGRFTAFIYIFICPILFTLNVVSICLFIDKFKKEKLVYKFIYCLFLIITVFVFFFDFRMIKTKLELRLFIDERREIIDKIKNDEFDYYSRGNIKLPIYDYVSSDGDVYVYLNEDNNQVIGFWICRGVLSGSITLVYSTGGEKLINENVGYVSSIEKLDDNWFYVITE